MLRGYTLTERGIFIYDEGHAMTVVRSYRIGLEWLASHIVNVDSEFNSMQHVKEHLLRYGGSIYTLGKPGHVLLITGLSLITGINDLTPLLISALFGIGSVILVFCIGKHVWSKEAGLAAALLLAASGFHTEYSRNALAFADSTFFVLLSLYLFFLAINRTKTTTRRVYYLLVGISVGMAFMCHYNTFWYVPALLILDSIYITKQRYGIKVLIETAGYIIAGFLLPIVIWESTLLALQPQVSAHYPGYLTYFGELRHILTKFHSPGGYVEQTRGARFSLHAPFFYFALLIKKEGIVFLIAHLTGLTFFIHRSIKEKRFAPTLMLALFLFPLILWTMYAYREERTFLLLIPLGTLIMAAGFEHLDRLIFKKQPRMLLGAICVLLVVNGTIKIAGSVLPQRSNIPEGARLASQHAIFKQLSITNSSMSFHSAAVWKFYLQGELQRNPTLKPFINFEDETEPGIFILDDPAYPDEAFISEVCFERLTLFAIVPSTPNLRKVALYEK